ncbi:MAG: hypothetical protein R3F60_14470 [bacterium]
MSDLDARPPAQDATGGRLDRGAPTDAGSDAQDARLADARLADARLADARLADARPTDAASQDARAPDAAPLDGHVPDARPADAGRDAALDASDRDHDARPVDALPPADADPACEPRACVSAGNEDDESACGDAAGGVRRSTARRLPVWAARSGDLLQRPTRQRRRILGLDYVFQPAPDDPADFRLEVDGLCLQPAEACAASIGAAATASSAGSSPGLIGAQLIRIYNHTTCGNRNRIVAELAQTW